MRESRKSVLYSPSACMRSRLRRQNLLPVTMQAHVISTRGAKHVFETVTIDPGETATLSAHPYEGTPVWMAGLGKDRERRRNWERAARATCALGCAYLSQCGSFCARPRPRPVPFPVPVPFPSLSPFPSPFPCPCPCPFLCHNTVLCVRCLLLCYPATHYHLQCHLPTLDYFCADPVPVPRPDRLEDVVMTLRHARAEDPLAIQLRYGSSRVYPRARPAHGLTSYASPNCAPACSATFDREQGGAHRLQAIVPYLIVNKTGLPMVVRQVCTRLPFLTIRPQPPTPPPLRLALPWPLVLQLTFAGVADVAGRGRRPGTSDASWASRTRCTLAR